MANNTIINGTQIEITLDGSTDWLWHTDLPDDINNGPIYLRAIQFQPSGNNDVMVIREASVDGSAMFRCKCSDDTQDKRIEMNKFVMRRPVIDASDITLSTAANARVYMELY